MFVRNPFLFLLIALSLFFQLPQVAQANSESRDEPDVFVPNEMSRRLPLIILLHGYAGNAAIMNYYFGLRHEVDSRKFILVVPNGKTDSSGMRFWNATPACCDFDHSNSDDVGYILNLIKEMKRRYKVDESRVFVVGHSNGAFMAHRLACEPNSPVRGIVSFAGAGFLNAKDCRATHPVSVLQIHSVDDDTIHFEGDPIGYPKLQPYPSAEQTIGQWLIPNHCFESARVQGAPRQITRFSGGDDTDTFKWANCDKSIELWRIRASDAFPHSPHTPFVTDAFAGSILDFLGL